MVFAHGWWLRSDAKMSKSSGNIVDPLPLLRDFGPDAVRYFLMREMAIGQDAQFSEEALVDRVNNDLANDLGNLVSRLLKMLQDFRGGRIPSPGADGGDLGLREAARRAVADWRAAFEEYRFHDGLASLWSLVGETNRFIVRHEPWSLAKDPSRAKDLDTVLYGAAEALRILAIGVAPVMPSAAQSLWSCLGGAGDVAARGAEDLVWGGLEPGQQTRRGEALFPRVDKAAYFANVKPEETSMGQDQPTPAAGQAEPETITIDDFMKVKLRVGRVLEAERVAGADRLLRLLVDIGSERRTVVAGIAQQYAPEALVGKSIILVANLAPRRMRGIESQGMLLAAEDPAGPIIATFESEVPPGSVVR
jgi:methionyl-tRNA synthetase